MLKPLKEFVFTQPLWHKFFKNRNELRHWAARRDSIIRWYRGEEAYIFPFHATEYKVTSFDECTNALLTFIKAENNHASYLHDLCLRHDSFEGLRVADIGSGPFPTLLVFDDAERYCIDHLIEGYKRIGFPLSTFEPDVSFMNAKSEQIPVSNSFFDAVISRNALDHVDDFPATATEIMRVLKPRGVLHILVNYHAPTSTEPHVLSDRTVQTCFQGLALRKISEAEGAWGFENGKTVLWSNAPASMLASASRTCSEYLGPTRNRTLRSLVTLPNAAITGL
jgi:SAM-dependent methyltransferase